MSPSPSMPAGGARQVRWGLALIGAVTAVALLAIWFDASPLLRGPAPYPPEWRWRYRSEPIIHWGLPACGFAAALLSLLVASGLRGAAVRRGRTAATVLALATVLGWGLQISLLALEDGNAAQTLAMRTADPYFTSYYTVAVGPLARDVGAFLQHHAQLLPTVPIPMGHVATHPPGAILYYRAVLAACEASPALTAWLVQLATRCGIDLQPFALPAGAARLAAALLSPLLLSLFCAAACWPVAALARRLGLGALEAARVGVLWTMLPGPVLMVPELDQALALPVTAAAALLAVVATRPTTWRRTAAIAVAAGVCGGVALFASYGAACFLVFAAGVAGAVAAARRRGHVALAAALAAATAVALNALPALWGHEPILAARTALAIHQRQFTQPRSYQTWLLFNAWDLAVFLGLPIALLLCARLARALGTVLHDGFRAAGAAGRTLLVVAAGTSALMLSGSVRGEAGRIWIPIMPFLLIAAMLRVPRASRTAAAAAVHRAIPGPSTAEAVLIGALLLASCWVLRSSWHLP